MTTKKLLSVLALGAVSASSMAQVYSVNSVGYVNTALLGNEFTLVSNPLRGATNTVAVLFAGVPEGTVVYRSVQNPLAPISINNYALTEEGVAWDSPNDVILPGEGVFVYNPAATVTITFVGEVMQGSLTNPIPAGLSMKASQVPQSGGLQTVLGYVPVEGDVVYLYDGSQPNPALKFAIYNYELTEEGLAWTPSEPVLGVGRGAWIDSENTKNWTRSFSVN